MRRLLIILFVIPVFIYAQDQDIEQRNHQTPVVQAQKPIAENSMSKQGKQDAKLYYNGRNCGKNITGLITSALTPVPGLIAAVSYASNPPKEPNLNYPSAEKMKDENYNSAYKRQAHKMKRRKVWGHFTIGSLISATAIILAVSWNN